MKRIARKIWFFILRVLAFVIAIGILPGFIWLIIQLLQHFKGEGGFEMVLFVIGGQLGIIMLWTKLFPFAFTHGSKATVK